MYNEINNINTSSNKFEYDGETITLQDCIDKMIKGCKTAIITDPYESTEEEIEIGEVIKIFTLCMGYLNW